MNPIETVLIARETLARLRALPEGEAEAMRQRLLAEKVRTCPHCNAKFPVAKHGQQSDFKNHLEMHK